MLPSHYLKCISQSTKNWFNSDSSKIIKQNLSRNYLQTLQNNEYCLGGNKQLRNKKKNNSDKPDFLSWEK